MNKINLKLKWVGIALVLTGSILWGVSGTVVQFLFQEKGFQAEWGGAFFILLTILILSHTSSEGKNRVNHGSDQSKLEA